MKNQIKGILQFSGLLLTDFLSYYTMILIVTLARIYFIPLILPMFPFEYSLKSVIGIWWFPLIFFGLFLLERLYQKRYPFWDEIKVLAKSSSISILVIFLFITIRNLMNGFDIIFLLLMYPVSIIIFPLFRYYGKMFLFKTGLWKKNVLIVGSGKTGINTLIGLINEPHLGYEVLGFIDDFKSNSSNSGIFMNGKEYKIYGKIDHIQKYCRLLNIDTIFITYSDHQNQDLNSLTNDIFRSVKNVIIIPEIHGIGIFNSELHYLFMQKLFIIKTKNNLLLKHNLIFKRIFELVLSFTFLLFFFPFLLIIIVIIKLNSPGRAIFTHTRVGKNGKLFSAYKFRSMYDDADKRLKEILDNDPVAKKEWETNFKLKNDPRITPIGKILRKTSLDEIPQIFNVIKGEMSLVGPRPVIQQEIEQYYGDATQYYHEVPPGLSGLWQVSGRSDTDYEFRTQTDVWYVQNWSIWLDIMIIIKTFKVVIKREGAY